MAQVQGEEIYLAHSGQEVDDNIDEVQAARGSEASLSAKIATKQDTLTFDSTPTAGSSNPVTSGGIYADQQRQQSEINYAVNAGAKNLVWYNREVGSQYTTQGRTFTVLSDGGIKITGNNITQANADFYLNGSWTTTNVIFDLSDKDYYISLSDNIGSTVGGIMFRAMNRSAGSTVAQYSVSLANRQHILKDKITTIFITITPAVTLPSDGIIVYPMIRPASITDDTFVPYAPTNRELYEMILALQSGRSVQSAASLMQAGRIDAELTDTENDDVKTGEEDEER